MSDPNNLVYREQLDDNVIDMLSEDIGSNYSLRTENTKTIASALNEIHGKDIIANAVGDPLLNTDSYSDMGSKIRELTVKLKNKLLSNGITIAEYDKLNSLIEKIDLIFDSNLDKEEALKETLKNILINKGIVVTGNETISELILKVDEIKPGSLNIISATNLPETGIDNQICIITDNPVDRFITTTNFDDTTGVSTDYITLYLGNTASFDATEGTLIELNQGNLLSRYYFVKACQGENRLDSYYWLNNQWNRLTQSGIYFVENGVERNHDYFGGIPAGPGAGFTTNGLTLLYSYNSPFKDVTTKNTINFSLYNKLDITVRNPDTSISYIVRVGYASTDHFTSQGWYPTNSTGGNQPEYSNGTDAYKEIQATRGQTVSQTIDISSWTGEGWLYLATFNGNMDLYITDLKLY